MLDKLEYFKAKSNTHTSVADAATEASDIAGLLKRLYSKMGYEVTLKPAGQGTLGITFLCIGLPKGPCFIKTHLPGEERYRACLEKEYQLLKVTGNAVLHVKQICFPLKNEKQLCLQMDLLDDSREVNPVSVCDIIKHYQKQIAGVEITGMYDLEAVLTAAESELEILHDNSHFSDKTYIKTKRYLTFLHNELPHIERCICHGDLSDRNIMVNKKDIPVVIDWEDAFWGCAEYDYLYWLTFFNHRKFYDQRVFSLMGTESNRSRAIVTMIIIVKCAISFYSGSYQQNSLTMENRLCEVWSFLEGIDEQRRIGLANPQAQC